jgi:hypothetical protein
MAKISTYPFPASPSLSDYVIGTDSNDALATKNFMISDILALGGTTYVPYTGAIQDVDLGSYSLYTYSLYMQGGPIYDGNGSPGSSSQILSSQGPGASPVWVDLSTLATAYVPYTGASQDVDLGSYLIYTYGVVLQGGTIVDGNDSEGTAGQVLTSQGPGNMPLWQDTSMVAKKYGSFYNNANQIPLAALPSSYPVIMGSVNVSSGVTVVTDGVDLTRITVSKTALYNISFSANVVNISGSKHVCYFFLRKNGNAPFNDVPDTLRYSDVAGNSAHTASLNYFIQLNAGDYVYLMFMVTNTSLNLIYNSATANYPATPSIILNVNEV